MTNNHLLGEIAQSVEQRTENPCVPSSILGFATTEKIFALRFRNLLYPLITNPEPGGWRSSTTW